MKKYDSYKDSGIDWIGEIPSHWKIMPLKRQLKEALMYGANEPAESDDINSPRYIRITDIDANGNLKEDTFKSLEYNLAQPYLLEKGDILFARSGATVGKTFLFNESYPACFAGYLIKAKCDNSLLPEFLYRYTNSGSYENWKNSIFIQSTIQNIGADKYSLLPIPIPPASEQKEIADYLDKKCGEIDTAVAKVDKELELLDELKQSEISKAVTKGLNPNVSFKSSGIDWIGEIPSHWKITRLKNNLDIFGRIGFRGYTNEDLVEEGEGAITLSPSNIIDGKIDYSKCSYLSWKKYYESPEIMIKEGDVIFVKTASVGKSALITHLPIETTLNPQIVVFKNLKIENRYLDYLLKTPLIDSQVKLSVGGSTILTITQEAIGSYRIPTPPISEQKEIADYLDRKCAEINSLKEKLKQKKEKLQELRQSLISEVVTGKRCVINS